MVLGRVDESGQPFGMDCMAAFRHGVSEFMWYPSIGGIEELTARIERLLTHFHRSELDEARQKAATEKQARSLPQCQSNLGATSVWVLCKPQQTTMHACLSEPDYNQPKCLQTWTFSRHPLDGCPFR